MNIRLAQQADAAALARVESTRPQAAGWAEQGFAGELRQPCARIWCACEGENIVGFLALRVAANCCEILNVAVLPSCSGRGTGYALMSHALEELKKQGPCHITLEVAEDNGPARALYDKAGFVLLGRRSGFYGLGRDALIMGMDV